MKRKWLYICFSVILLAMLAFCIFRCCVSIQRARELTDLGASGIDFLESVMERNTVVIMFVIFVAAETDCYFCAKHLIIPDEGVDLHNNKANLISMIASILIMLSTVFTIITWAEIFVYIIPGWMLLYGIFRVAYFITIKKKKGLHNYR